MFDPSSFANPTPLAHADTSKDVLPRGGTSQHRGSILLTSYWNNSETIGNESPNLETRSSEQNSSISDMGNEFAYQAMTVKP
ncbi:hypothetical protein TNCV_3483901 [Trichonephila clavipes]|nr:hypothetical protein TNCV_3483901 [Trichonephila clavipes]